ncbi:polymorphic toxin-type HINT domain-containing protein [Streptomyces sp. NPDC047999]|uniref:polymorphic toxin-type HINT domain-containing protein n=1 Tax=Streptomyces sp. NPDC047999 TaxID=3365497 RepID=UPI00371A58FC
MTRRISRRWAGSVVIGLSLALSAGTVQAVPVEAAGTDRPGVQDLGEPAQGKNARTKPRGADPAAKAAVETLDAPEWPDGDSTTLRVGAQLGSRDGVPKGAAAPGGTGDTATIGGLPVTASDAHISAKATAGSEHSPAARAGSPAPDRVRVSSLGQERAAELGSAALLRVQRADGVETSAPVELTVNYAKFAEAYGGDYGARLRLVELPACAAKATPGSRDCPELPKPLDSRNDADARTVTATVEADADRAGLSTHAGEAAPLLAVTGGDSSSQGDYRATPLSPSSKWSVANSSGGFSWNYPIRTVPTPGGLTPSVGLGYSSQAVDGRTSATNNQGSWAGEGFSYEPGYIERRYKPCSDDGHKSSAEQCWAFDNATIMLEGASGELIKDDTSGKWHLASENGARVEQLTGAHNGDDNGEHWKVTTTDGTEYYFGLNRRPGWTSGKEETDSTWTVPVFGDDAGEPCHNATFSKAHCQQAWRWNLDYVKDAHGNVMSYLYGKETNHYALNGKTDVEGTAYTRGGYLKRIDHGQRDGKVFSTDAGARVVFHTAERCLPTKDFDCAAGTFTKANARHWPDTPVDRYCKAGAKCDSSQVSATFWTRKRLTGITTQMHKGSGAYTDVDAWTFTHLFTDNGDDSKTLWLSAIDHEGRVGGSAKLPSLELQGIQLKNRVDKDGDNIAPFHRFRLASVLTETGTQLDVNYAPTECTADKLPKPGEQTGRCYPVRWAPPGHIDPITDWFHKYVVAEIIETDRTGGGEDVVTRYDYKGDAGWRHGEPDGITDEKFLTWDQWQGYGKVTVTSGNGQTMSTRLDYTYLQGLDGDKKPGGGTRTEEVTDSTGKTYTGHEKYTGFELETRTWDGDKVVSKVISEPWKHDTATQTRKWKTTKATIVQPRVTRGYTALASGGWRETKSTSWYETGNRTGRVSMVEDLGDVSTAEDDKCTRLWYTDNTSEHMYELPSRSEAVSVSCSATPDRRTQVIADERTSYDGGSFGDQPTRGDATKTERLASHDGSTATYQVTGHTTYDVFGRPTSQTDAVGARTTTEYTDVNGLISKTKATNALGHVTTTDFAPAWGQSAGQTDPNGKRTDFAYDPLGRLVSLWLPDRPRTHAPSIKYSYLVRRDKPVAVKTEKIEISGSYGVEWQLYDGLLRPRQLQTEGPDGSRMVADTFYDGVGKIKKTNSTYNAVGAPSGELLEVGNGEVGAQTLYEYDGLGRPTKETFAVAGVPQWSTTSRYDGDRTHLDPPQGGVPVTKITNAADQITELRYHHGESPAVNGPPGPGAGYDATKFSYTPGGELAEVTDAEGNVWQFEYDQMGRKVKTVDPDIGVSTFAYDAADRPVSGTDARGKKRSTVYDKLGRTLTTWEGEPNTGTRLTETRYDRPGWLGQAWASLRYVNGGSDYFATVTQSMDAFYQPLKTAYSVPKSEGALAGTYTFTTGYNFDGTVQGIGMPAAGGLGNETVVFGYDDLQRPTSMRGKTSYVTDTVYSNTSLLQQLELSDNGGQKLWQTFQYEKGTDRLTRAVVDVSSQSRSLKAAHYSYDQSGKVLSISDTADTAAGSADLQCFAYDNGQRLAEAWTPAATAETAAGAGTSGAATGGSRPSACTAPAGGKALGGPAPYWKSYEVDAIGNRTKEVIHDTGLNAAEDITRTYTYGEGAAGPHAVTKVVEDGPSVDQQYTYAYDATGNTTERVIGGDAQKLEWDVEGQLVRTTEAGGAEATYVYDAGGDRVVRRDATATTVYLPGMELRLAKGSSKVEATRYYSFAGQTVAVRSDSGNLAFLSSDHHGTGQLAVDATTGSVSQRRFDPYGLDRGSPVGEWPGEKGFVGGTIDKQTGLTSVGAREYDPALGKFISVDPIIDYRQPQQINGYAYANNSPVTLSDPSGEFVGFVLQVMWAMQAIAKYSELRRQQAVYRAQNDRDRAERQYNDAKQQTKQAAKALVKIAKQELGIDAALDCFSSGDLGSCGETALNIASSFVGGLAGKLLAKYGSPFKWKKGWQLVKRVRGLLDDLIGGAMDMWKRSEVLDKAKDKLAAAKAKVTKQASACLTKHSFPPGTGVLLADGKTKPIEEVELGDSVTVTDPETGETTTREVVATIVTEDDKDFVDLTVRSDGSAAALISTTTHPFWAVDEAAWIDAGDIKPGTRLRTPEGDTVEVAKIRHFEKRQRTHDLTIEDVHTYYVLAGRTPVLVHNASKPDQPNIVKNAIQHLLAGNLAQRRHPNGALDFFMGHDLPNARAKAYWADDEANGRRTRIYSVPGGGDDYRLIVRETGGVPDAYAWVGPKGMKKGAGHDYGRLLQFKPGCP